MLKYKSETLLFKLKNLFNSNRLKRKTKLMIFVTQYGELYGYSLNRIKAIRYCRDQTPKLKGLLVEKRVSPAFVGYMVMNKVNLVLPIDKS